MATNSRFVLPYQFLTDPSGAPLVGAQLMFYLTGTSTPSPTYSDPGLTTPNTNPVQSGTGGLQPGTFGNIFLNPSITYKVVALDGADNPLWTADPVTASGGGDSATERVPISDFGVLGTSDDTAVWQAAINSGEALLAPAFACNIVTLALTNCTNILGIRGKTILNSLPEGQPMLILSNPYNTFITLEGLILQGDRGAQPITGIHRGVYFLNAYNGVDDEQYRANNPTGTQVPEHYLDLFIRNFNDEGFYKIGAGDNEWKLNIGGCRVGIFMNGYDDQFTNPIVGGCDEQGWILQAGATRVIGGKTYFCGGNLTPGATASMDMTLSTGCQVSGHQLQDGYGSMLLLASPGYNLADANLIDIAISRNAQLSRFDPAATADIDIRGSFGNNVNAQIFWNVGAGIQRPTYIMSNTPNGIYPLGTGNRVCATLVGAQVQPLNLYNIGGDWDGSFYELGADSRVPVWIPADDGDAFFGMATQNGGFTGLLARGPNSVVAPGAVLITNQADQQDSGFTTTATAATATLTSSQNYANGETVTIDTEVYTFQTVLTDVAGNVHIGASEAASILNLHHATNGYGGVPGVDYALATQPNIGVTATDDGAHVLTASAGLGSAGNAIAVSTTAAHAVWSGATLGGGTDGVQTYNVGSEIGQLGQQYFPNLPTADPHVVGQAWNNAGIVYISAG